MAGAATVVAMPDVTDASSKKTEPQRQTSCTTALTECAAMARKFWTFGALFLVLVIITSTNLGLDAAEKANATQLLLQQVLREEEEEVGKQVSSRFIASLKGQVEQVLLTLTATRVPDVNHPRAGVLGTVSGLEANPGELSEG
jgi:hypothetical protein